MKQQLILRITASLILPFILVFGIYVQLHGDLNPGGGFQAGTIIAAAFILYGLVFGMQAAERVFPQHIAVKTSALGLLLYTGTAALTLAMGSDVLNYNALLQNSADGQQLGIWLVEMGVCITVSSVMVLIYYVFGRYASPPEK